MATWVVGKKANKYIEPVDWHSSRETRTRNYHYISAIFSILGFLATTTTVINHFSVQRYRFHPSIQPVVCFFCVCKTNSLKQLFSLSCTLNRLQVSSDFMTHKKKPFTVKRFIYFVLVCFLVVFFSLSSTLSRHNFSLMYSTRKQKQLQPFNQTECVCHGNCFCIRIGHFTMKRRDKLRWSRL